MYMKMLLNEEFHPMVLSPPTLQTYLKKVSSTEEDKFIVAKKTI